MFSLGGLRAPYDPADKRLVCIRSPCPAGPHPRRGGGPTGSFPGGLRPHASLPINSKVSLEWNGVRMAWMTVHLVSGNPFIEASIIVSSQIESQLSA